ncbi:MAG: nucleoside triphosphate pyrophosphohydrolase [Candidatus Marinimicrobia bacterium]|jgi:predicted house-cleaning noncanonical NTP pyrophosphatase (MazG superfamily)|nr:nucleoside triphosphate pyrophosphohydrolase [Candidatus Neomarinimicrobiota bacterium]
MYKLIRNKYRDIIPKSRLSNVDPKGETYKKFLMDKLNEELQELADSDWSDVNEYADVYEVFLAIMKAHGVDEDDVLKAKIEKVITNGSFSDGLLLKD